MDQRVKTEGREHWADKNGKKLFMFEKRAVGDSRGAILFVHGSTMASLPTFDLQVPDSDYVSAMDWFSARGFDVWTVDMEGYGLSHKDYSHNCGVETGADDCEIAARYIRSLKPETKLLVYGSSSGALRAALFAQKCPEMVSRLALDAFVYTGAGSPTLEQRRKKLPVFQASNSRPIDRAFMFSIFERDHASAADKRVVEALASATLAQDDKVPTGTYVDMCTRLPLVDPKKITVPTLIMRGEYDGIASTGDILDFFAQLPNADKQFTIMKGIAHATFQQKNYLTAYHILLAFFSQPALIYEGEERRDRV